MKSFKNFIEEICEVADSGLAAKASKSGISIGTLRKVYRRGVAAWNSGHRPGTTPQQWGMARVNSYISKGKGTYGGADKDLHEGDTSDLPRVSKDKKSGLPKKYVKGLSTSTAKARAAHWEKANKLSDSDPRAYKPAPGDATAKTKPSKYTVKYHAMYGENMDEEILEACWVGYKQVGVKKKGNKMVPNCVPEDVDYMFHPLAEAAKAIDSGEYDYEGQMARTQLQTILRNSKDLINMLSDEENMPEWVQSKITLAQDYISCVRDYLQSKEELGENWSQKYKKSIDCSNPKGFSQRAHCAGLKKQKNEEVINERGADSKGYFRSTESGAGLTAKGAAHFRNQNPGSKLGTAVTGSPKPGSKDANRRKSFCARMSGMPGPMKDEKGRPTRKAMSLRRWKCR
jgi:hypothetical protein